MLETQYEKFEMLKFKMQFKKCFHNIAGQQKIPTLTFKTIKYI